MASIPLLTPHSHITPDTAVVYSGHLRHPIWPWPANLIQRLNKLPHMSIRVRQGVIGIWSFWGIFFCFFYLIYFWLFLMWGTLRCMSLKMSSHSDGCITKCKELTFDLLHFWPLTFGIVWRKFGAMSPNLAPKYIIWIFQREDKLLLNMERKQTTYCKLFHQLSPNTGAALDCFLHEAVSCLCYNCKYSSRI